MDFKVGDRVVVARNNPGWNGLIGDISSIETKMCRDQVVYAVKIDSFLPSDVIFFGGSLELVDDYFKIDL
jgi:hypothetical protein